MNKKVKKAVAAMMVTGMALSGAAGVYAGAKLQTISAYLNNGLAFTVNGTTYVPKDGNGQTLAPITYQDLTYLPVRALSEALGAGITYDAQTGIIAITPSGQAGTGTQAGDLVSVTFTAAQLTKIKQAYAGFEGFTTPYAPFKMVKGDTLRSIYGGDEGADSVGFLFDHMRVQVSPRDYSVGYDSTSVALSNGVQAKWYTPSDTPMLTFSLDDRFVTLSSADHTLSKADLESVAVSVAKLR